jgi:protein-L-isoaspartate(D-aspartate) O-methyltransferase
MVVPLAFATCTRSITFVRDGDRFDGRDPAVCGFVAMQGAGAHGDRQASLAGGAVRLSVEGGPDLDPAALGAALAGEGTDAWTGVSTGNEEPYDTLNLWLVTADDRAGTIWQEDASTVARPAARWNTPALITPDSFAYLTARPASQGNQPGDRRHEFGVRAHGPARDELTRLMAGQIRRWDSDRRGGPGPGFTLYLADAAVPAPETGRIFRKKHTQLVMSWP